jgi:predicted DsbA family dithiol-disulfide isomerase
LLEKYSKEVNLVIKHYPLRSHKYARQAAIAALAADKQGKYAELTRIFYQKKNLNDETVKQYAAEIGMDVKQLENDKSDPALQQIILQDINAARRVQVRGVPALYINGKVVKNRSPMAMGQMIEAEAKKK